MKPRHPILLAVLVLCAHVSLHAMSEEEARAEAEQESLEDRWVGRKKGDAQVPETLLQGRYYPNPDVATGNPAAVGFFVAKGHVYHLRVGNERLRTELVRKAGQDISLEGEVRNQGKYFIAQRFASALPPSVALRDRKGL